MKFSLQSICFALICLAVSNLNAQRIGHSDERWQTIRTEHFDTIVNSKQLDLGRHYALAAEQAYQNLSQVFNLLPSRLVIVVNDTTDVSNGFATRIPYPNIMAYSVLTADHDSLSESGDWAELLITHELTHILQFEPAAGFYSVLRPIFGNIIAPNMLMPAWWKEGMSVEMETRFSTTGRLRSDYQNAALRAIVLENKISEYDIAQANETLPTWPYGLRPYLFGSVFFSQLVTDRNDLKAVNYLAETQGSRAPYYIEKTMEELAGNSYESTYNKALFTIAQYSQEDFHTLSQAPMTSHTQVTTSKQTSLRPTISETHGLVAYIQSVEDESQVEVKKFEGESLVLKKRPAGGIQGLQFHPTEKKLIYSKIDRVDSKYNFSDLYEYDIDAGVSTQLTFSARARNPQYSATGDRIAFITTVDGQTQIRLYNIADKSTQFITTSGFTNRFESVVFWDENTLLISKSDAKGRYSIIKYNLIDKSEATLLLAANKPRFLKVSNGKLYFVSNDNGVNNIYESADLASATPLTNVATGIWSFDFTKDKSLAYASLMTGDGFKVVKLNELSPQAQLPKIENKIAARYPEYQSQFTAVPTPAFEYEPGSYLWPSYWIPFISTGTGSRGIFFQAQTEAHDPLGIHRYALVASYDSELQKGNFNGAYINSSLDVPVKLLSTLGSFALGTNKDVVERNVNSISLLPDLFSINKSLLLDIGWQLQGTHFLTRSLHQGPFFEVAYANYSKNIFEISPETGWGASLRFEHLNLLEDETGGISAKDFDRAQFAAVKFLRGDFMPEHHAIKGRISGYMTYQSVLGRFGTNTAAGFIEQDGVSPQIVNRGYSSGQFFGRNLWNANLEYRFPFSTVNRGNGTDPFYFKRISGALIADFHGLDGFGVEKDLLTTSPVKADRAFSTGGLELKLESTIGYILPTFFVLGYYLPETNEFNNGGQFGFSMQISGF